MASYSVRWRRSARKELRKLPSQTVRRIVAAVENLTEDPYPSGIRKLAGSRGAFRLRVGEYRVIYAVEGTALVIEIVRVGHRKDIYRP